MIEASSTDTPYGRYITSDGWFVLNLGDALATPNSICGFNLLHNRDPGFDTFSYWLWPRARDLPPWEDKDADE